ncbi:unnamed protein product [Rhodiola kirilowii]
MNIPACAPPTATRTPKQLSNQRQKQKPFVEAQPPPQKNLSFDQNSSRNVTISNDKLRRQQPIDPTVLWTSSIARRCRTGQLDKAASEFTAMRLAGVQPNHITFITLFSACGDSKLSGKRFGSSIHGMMRKLGYDVRNVMVGTAAVDMYSKFGNIDAARILFDEMLVRNNVSWNTMINGYMRAGKFEDAIDLFDAMPDRDAISWTALINGFVKKEHFEQALVWFREMQLSGVEPDYVTIISVLAACANLGMLGLGLWLHRFILKHDFRDNIRVNNSLIDMYSRCGCIEYARQVFQNMSTRSLVSWNSIIVGFAVNGHAIEALKFFDLMQKEGFEPDEVSLTGALTACSHAGFVNEGLQLYHDMKKIHKINPRIEHYGCIVDLYSRAGKFDEALDIIDNMPMKPNEVVLGSLLAACRTRDDVKLAERVMKLLEKLDPRTDSNYVLLSNIYAAVGEWRGANAVRRKMKNLGIRKSQGISSIEVDFSIHEFASSDKSHAETDAIYQVLDHLSCELGLHGPHLIHVLNKQEASTRVSTRRTASSKCGPDVVARVRGGARVSFFSRSWITREEDWSDMEDVSKDAQMSLVAVSARFPGFRFSPTDEELISYYLKQKTEGSEKSVEVIPEVEICRYEPWDLPGKSVIQSDSEWFFFSPRGRKYPNGSQSKRATEFGYWKATGKERNVKSNTDVIGTKRTLVFHLGRAPKGQRTEWIMHEYCMQGNSQDPLVVCRLRKNSDFRMNQGSHQDSASQKDLSVTSNITNQAGFAGGPSDADGHTGGPSDPDGHIGFSDGERADNGSSRKCSSSHDSYSIEQNEDGFESDSKVPQDATQPESSSCHKDCDNDDFYAEILNDDIVKLFDESSLTTNPTREPFVSSMFDSRTEQLSRIGSTAPFQGIARRRIRFDTTKVDIDELEMQLNPPQQPCLVTKLTGGWLSGKVALILLILALFLWYHVTEMKLTACSRLCKNHM